MASILVYIESSGDRPTPESLQVLGEGRRVATSLGASLCALVLQTHRTDESLNSDRQRTQRSKMVRALGQGGADKVQVMPLPERPGPATWVQQGPALHAACDHLQPQLVLIAATHSGRDIAPRLAARLESEYLCEPSFEYGPEGEITLFIGPSNPVRDPHESRRVSVEDLPRCSVATLAPGSHRPMTGGDEAKVISLVPPEPMEESDGVVEYLGSAIDAAAELSRSPVIVVAGDGVKDAETFALVGRLADALGGQLAATPALARRGIAPHDRVIGMGSRWVSPELYVVCAASSSREHLDAVSRDACIVAIAPDPDATIFQVARYGIVGELAEVLPALIEALSTTRAESATS